MNYDKGWEIVGTVDGSAVWFTRERIASIPGREWKDALAKLEITPTPRGKLSRRKVLSVKYARKNRNEKHAKYAKLLKEIMSTRRENQELKAQVNALRACLSGMIPHPSLLEDE